LKPEQWGSLLVQENNQEGKACDKRRIIIIIIIIIIIHEVLYCHKRFSRTVNKKCSVSETGTL
jgi:hypothetical protein